MMDIRCQQALLVFTTVFAFWIPGVVCQIRRSCSQQFNDPVCMYNLFSSICCPEGFGSSRCCMPFSCYSGGFYSTCNSFSESHCCPAAPYFFDYTRSFTCCDWYHYSRYTSSSSSSSWSKWSSSSYWSSVNSEGNRNGASMNIGLIAGVVVGLIIFLIFTVVIPIVVCRNAAARSRSRAGVINASRRQGQLAPYQPHITGATPAAAGQPNSPRQTSTEPATIYYQRQYDPSAHPGYLPYAGNEQPPPCSSTDFGTPPPSYDSVMAMAGPAPQANSSEPAMHTTSDI